MDQEWLVVGVRLNPILETVQAEACEIAVTRPDGRTGPPGVFASTSIWVCRGGK